MVVALYITPGGYCLFKVKDKSLLKDHTSIYKAFATPQDAKASITLQAMNRFTATSEALTAASSITEGTLDPGLVSFLKKELVDKDLGGEKLAILDVAQGAHIKEQLKIKCLHNEGVEELFRGIRLQFEHLANMSASDLNQTQLGLSHALARHSLKFSPDKVDTMIIQAISLLDELDKELNTYAMRVREWYGWHFPEMGKIVTDNSEYAKVVINMGTRDKCKGTDFGDFLEEDTEERLKEESQRSMGTEISASDVSNIQQLAQQVIDISAYRTSLWEYLQHRMQAIAPNLSLMVGELVGARLIAHAGSLLSLAKHPASTVQILGAEKALFRALKTKHDTPKYGLIYNASLVGQAHAKHKGRISRVLAAKTSLSARADALGDVKDNSIARGFREKVEARLRFYEGGKPQSAKKSNGDGPSKYTTPANIASYGDVNDVVMGDATADKQKKKKKKSKKADSDSEEAAKVEKKKKKKKREREEDEEAEKDAKKKKKKAKHE